MVKIICKNRSLNVYVRNLYSMVRKEDEFFVALKKISIKLKISQ